jgi:hypothetical protein
VDSLRSANLFTHSLRFWLFAALFAGVQTWYGRCSMMWA